MSALIDWSTFPIYSNTSYTGDDYTCMVYPQVAGKYLVIGSGRVQKSGATWLYAYLKQTRNGVQTSITGDQSTGAVNRAQFNPVGIVDIRPGDTIHINFNTETGTSGMTVGGVSLVAILIQPS